MVHEILRLSLRVSLSAEHNGCERHHREGKHCLSWCTASWSSDHLPGSCSLLRHQTQSLQWFCLFVVLQAFKFLSITLPHWPFEEWLWETLLVCFSTKYQAARMKYMVDSLAAQYITRTKEFLNLWEGGRRPPATSDDLVISTETCSREVFDQLPLDEKPCHYWAGSTSPCCSRWYSLDGSLCLSSSSVFTSLPFLFNLSSVPGPHHFNNCFPIYCTLSPVGLSLDLNSRWPVTCFGLPYRSKHYRSKPQKSPDGCHIASSAPVVPPQKSSLILSCFKLQRNVYQSSLLFMVHA